MDDFELASRNSGSSFPRFLGVIRPYGLCIASFIMALSIPLVLFLTHSIDVAYAVLCLVFTLVLAMVVVLFNLEVRYTTRTLAESDSRHRDLVENLPGAVFRAIRSDRWRIVFLSDAIEAISGYAASDFCSRGRSLKSIMHPDDRHLAENFGKEISRRRFDIDFRIVTASGNIRWIHARGTMKALGSGPPTVSGILIDITEQKSVVELLTQQQSRMAAAARLSALGEMAGGIAHEINNPLAIINLRTHQLSSLAAKGTVPAEEVKAIAIGIENTVLRISKIVRSLQTVARESEQDPFDRVAVSDIIHDAFELCYQRMRKHGIDVAIGEISPTLEVDCRRVQISQVLINLLNNAFDAVVNSPRPKVTIDARDFIESGVPMVEIAITDSGTGITLDLAHRIFQPFFTTKGVGKGIGLGLSISKGMIESHDGHIRVDTSAPTTRFVIVLPKYHASRETAEPKAFVRDSNTAGAGQESLVHS